MLKPKRQNLNKAQIAAQMKTVEKSLRLKKIAKENVYPTLFKASSISEAKIICEVISAVASAKISNHWADKKFSELGLIEELSKDESQQDMELYMEILTALNDVDITDAQEIMSTMGGALDNFILKDSKNLPVPPVAEIIND